MSFGFRRFIAIPFFFLASILIVQTSGELVVLKHPLENSYGIDNFRDITCVSENDNAALIWNLNVNNKISMDFEPGTRTSKNGDNCAISNLTDCIARWQEKHGWDVVKSTNRPMGPVLDHRWEGFEEFLFNESIKQAEYQYVGKMNESSDTAVFSTRGSKDVGVFLCETEQAVKGRCLWILLAYKNEKSAIRACAKAPDPSQTTSSSGPCDNLAEHKLKNVIDKLEWRTFAIKWIKERKTIQVFKEANDEPFLQGYADQWHDLSHISVRNVAGTRFRFHFYSYLESRAKSAKLSTTSFNPVEQNFCVNMLVGLCPKCELNVKLVENRSILNRSMKAWNISGGKSVYNGVLAWRWVELQVTLPTPKPNDVRLEIQTILNKDKDQGQWAIGGIRVCQPLGASRKSTINTRPKNFNEVGICQKLSYNGSTVVDARSTTTTDLYAKDLEQFSQSRRAGQGWLLCNPFGCTCAQGFMGENCATECPPGFYGYNCNEKCGSCSGEPCDRKNGYCRACNGENLVPPLCKKQLKNTTIDKVTDNTARLQQVLEVAVEVADWIDVLYFNVQGKPIRIRPSNRTRSGNFLTYTADIKGLERNTMYEVFTEFRVKLVHKESIMKSSKNYFVTTCFGKPRFEIIPRESEITVKRHNSRGAGCVELPNGKHLLTLRGTNYENQVVNPQVFYSFEALTPHTEYELTIFSMNNDLLWKSSITTLQSAPEKVIELRRRHVSDTEVVLEWKAPPEKDYVIIGYTVSIQREAVLACEDLNRKIPPEKPTTYEVTDTMISVNGLHPYARYRATVIAHTSESSTEPAPFTFQTDPKYIPTSVVHNLRLANDNRRLEWEEPEDCTTISGKISASVVFIAGASEWATNSTHRFQTENQDSRQRIAAKYYSFNIDLDELLPYTKYRVQVYVIRERNQPENLTSYKETMLMTKPAAPHAVSDFEVYDANIEKKRISLRWRPPRPPTGEIEFYRVTIKRKNSGLPEEKETLDVTTMCELWEDFVCLENLPSDLDSEIEVQVHAKNKEVEEEGPVKNLTFKLAAYDQAPAEPIILKESFEGRGVVSFKWEHPFSPTFITEFQIYVKYLNTRLQEEPSKNFPTPFIYRVTNRQKTYTMELPLAPSTVYNISIKSIREKKSSRIVSKTVEVANGFGFPDGEELIGKLNGTLINVKVPPIVNATRNATARVVVEGPLTCQDLNSQPMNITELTIDEYKGNISTPRNLMIGVNQTNTKNLNCSLSLEGTPYTVKVIVVDQVTNTTVFTSTVTIDLTNRCTLYICLSIVTLVFCCGCVFVFCIKLKKFKLARRRKKTALVHSPATRCKDDSIALYARSTDHLIRVEDPNSIIYASPYESDSRVVLVEYFPQYVKSAATGKHLISQFETLPKDLTKPCHYGRLPQNIEKNRDLRLIAYDDTRVVLNKLPGEPFSDYINASYIQGHRGDKAYIATQGPMPNTVNDFWRMIWQEKVYVVCMLTNIVENEEMKCEQYWPANETQLKYGDISVLVIDHQTFPDYTVRIIKLSCQKYKRKITHLHYTGWPSVGIPTYPQYLVKYLKKLRETSTKNGPVVVHCDTGTGRTGTLILCDICSRQAVAEKVVDVLAVTSRMRASRANMVRSAKQYIFSHVVIMESIATPSTLIPCDDDLVMQIQEFKKQLPEHVKELNDRVWQDQVLYSSAKPQPPTIRNCKRILLPVLDAGMKNVEFCPDTPDVIYFERYSVLPTVDKNYIDAVSVDGVRSKKQYLASQHPSTSTWSKFWRIIAMENIELIIILQPPDPRDPTSRNIVPDESSSAPAPNLLVVKNEGLQEENHFTIEKLLLTKTLENRRIPWPVTVLTCTGWEQGENGKPPIPEALVSMFEASENILRKKTRTLVLCHDGVTGCGLYLALSFLLEKMAVDRECDVISAVRAVRRFRPEFVQSIEQFEYLYDAAAEYAKCFEGYSNFSS